MINDTDAIQDLVAPAAKTPIQHIVTAENLIDLVELLHDGPHAYISDRVSVGEDRWMVTVETRSLVKMASSALVAREPEVISALPTMRELINQIDPREAINLDVPPEDIKADRLIDVVQQIDALSDRIEDAIFARLSDTTIEEANVGPSGISPQTAAQRSQRDARRRDQLNQLGKKQAAVRASMGT